MLCQQAIARLPLRIDGEVDRAIGALGIGMPVDDMADALDAGMGGLGGQQRIDIRVIEGGEGDETGGEAVDGGERVEPLGLAQRAFRRRAGIDMDGADDVPTGQVFAILGDAIIAGDRPDTSIISATTG